MSDRVVVTGMGILSPLGLDVESTWEGLLAGRSGIDTITLFDPEGLETTIGGEVKGFDPANYMDRKEVRRTDRFVQLAVAATREAVAQAHLTIDDTNAEDVGVIIGSGIGGITTLEQQIRVLIERGPSRITPFLVPMMIVDMASGQVSIATGAKGPNYCTVSACASGADAIGNAWEMLRRGEAQAMIAGGAEAGLCPIGVASFSAARALSTHNHEPQKASRPFDAGRDGFVIGEGSAILVLERLDYAQQRGAPILAELVGYGATADAYHITHPPEGGEGGARSMLKALRRADLKPQDIHYINAHGTSTPLNDMSETMAIKRVFGEHAYRIPISSSKSMVGHLMGAAGAIESAVCILSLQHGVVHPTINYDHPDPECDLDYVPNVARQVPIQTALTNSFGFGGHNAALIYRRWEGV